MQKTKLPINIIYILLIVLGLNIQSCAKLKKQSKTNIEKWFNREIKIPENLKFKSMGRDTIGSQILNHQYKVLVYLDSLGCIPCRLRLVEWKEYMDNWELNGYDVGFLFVVQSSNYKHLEMKLYADQFSYPIIYDPENTFNKLNHFPKEEQFRTFLLDAKNRVILIGSPIENIEISLLYDKVLRVDGDKKNVTKLSASKLGTVTAAKTKVELLSDSLYLGKILYSSIKSCTFVLKNKGKSQLIIQSIKTSCGCTAAKYDKKPIAQGETTTVVLEYKPNSLGYFSKSADVICNVPEGFIRLKIRGEVVEK